MTKLVALWGRDDHHDGSSVNQAFRSIQGALNAINSEQIQIYSGKYQEELFGTYFNLLGIGHVELCPPTPSNFLFSTYNRGCILKNLHLIGFTNLLQNASSTTHPNVILEELTIIQQGRALMDTQVGGGSVNFTMKDSLFIRVDFSPFDLYRAERSTFHACHLQIRKNSDGLGYVQNCLITSSHCDFQQEVIPIRNTLFGLGTTFTYSDGVNSVANADFDTFKTANETHDWGFNLTNCAVQDEGQIYQHADGDDYSIQPSSLAIGMATDNGAVGAKKESGYAAATDAGWQNNSNFTLVNDQFEASVEAAIEGPIIDLGKNKPIYMLGGGLQDAWEDGRIFHAGGQLADPIVTGGSQTGLSIALEEGKVYCVEGFIEVETSQRGLTFTSQQCFTGLANETIIATTASGAGAVREVKELTGNLVLLARFWKEGEQEPAEWKRICRGKPVLIDGQGRGNGEEDYDAADFPRHPVARYLRIRAALSTNNLKS